MMNEVNKIGNITTTLDENIDDSSFKETPLDKHEVCEYYIMYLFYRLGIFF